MGGVTVTELAATPTGQVPGFREAAVTALPPHHGQALALAAGTVAVAVSVGRAAGRLAAQVVAHTLWKGNSSRDSECPLNKGF